MVKLLKRMRWYYWVLILLTGISVYGQVTFELMLPQRMNQVITILLEDGSMSEVWPIGLRMVGIVLASSSLAILGGFFAARVAAGYASDIRRDVFTKIESFSLEELEGFSTASLITRTTNDVVQIQMVIIMIIRLSFMGPIMAYQALTKALERSSMLSMNILITVSAMVVVIAIIFIIVIPRFSRLQTLTDRLNLVTRENLTGLRVVRASNAEDIQEGKFETENKRFMKTNIFVNRVASLLNPSMQIALNFLTLSIVWIGASVLNGLAVNQRADMLGDILEFQQYAVQVVFAFMMMTMLVIFIPRAIVSGRRIQEVFDRENKITDPENPVVEFPEVGTVEFRNVSFSYPDAEEPVVKDITFKVNSGETVAFIGSTGSGKSTIINLIPRFFDATTGEVLVDGVNVKEMRLHDLREKIGYAPQRGMLFKGTIESNLTYGRKNPTPEEIEEALEISQAKEFVDKLPEGIKSPISQGGTNVSGGQRQRLSIARAIIKKPEIYIFDDSFSALDFKTERVLREGLEKSTKGITKLIVAQRIGSIMNADKIVVLDKGQIVGIGKHKDLLKTCDVYHEIALSQLSKEELE